MALNARAIITPYADSQGTVTGAITVNGWQGWIPTLQNQGDESQRLGETGSLAQITAKRGTKKTCTMWVGLTDKAAALAFAERWETLNLRVCRVVDGFDRNLPRVRLSNCNANVVRTRGPIYSGTTPVSYRVELSADFERMPNA